jgi:hypothetical protein
VKFGETVVGGLGRGAWVGPTGPQAARAVYRSTPPAREFGKLNA